MRIKDLIAHQGKSLSFEFFPPKTAEDENSLFDTIEKLQQFKPTFVSVTYGAGGGTSKNTARIVKRIGEERSITAMPHLTCVGQDRAELIALLTEYMDMGVDNILALRGDLPKDATGPHKNALRSAKDLVELISSFNAFSIGVAVYPEGHIQAPSLEADLLYTKQKVDAGADFAITQMFFENRYYYDFVDKAQRLGISIPIIPGIMPIADIEKVKKFAGMCGATLPRGLVERMENARSPQEARDIGVDFATRQCEGLWKNGVRYFHFYTLNNYAKVSQILINLGWGTPALEGGAHLLQVAS